MQASLHTQTNGEADGLNGRNEGCVRPLHWSHLASWTFRLGRKKYWVGEDSNRLFNAHNAIQHSWICLRVQSIPAHAGPLNSSDRAIALCDLLIKGGGELWRIDSTIFIKHTHTHNNTQHEGRRANKFCVLACVCAVKSTGEQQHKGCINYKTVINQRKRKKASNRVCVRLDYRRHVHLTTNVSGCTTPLFFFFFQIFLGNGGGGLFFVCARESQNCRFHHLSAARVVEQP